MTAPCHAFLNDSSNIFVKSKGYNNIRESKKKNHSWGPMSQLNRGNKGNRGIIRNASYKLFFLQNLHNHLWNCSPFIRFCYSVTFAHIGATSFFLKKKNIPKYRTAHLETEGKKNKISLLISTIRGKLCIHVVLRESSHLNHLYPWMLHCCKYALS